MAPDGSVPVTAIIVVVPSRSVKTRRPAGAVTDTGAAGPVTVKRMAPSDPALGVVRRTSSVPARGPVGSSPHA